MAVLVIFIFVTAAWFLCLVKAAKKADIRINEMLAEKEKEN